MRRGSLPHQINMVPSLVNDCLDKGGSIHPLLISPELTKHLSLCNASILELKKNSRYLLNIRWVSYYLHHCENNQKYQTPWGPLNYVRPDCDGRLRTENYICDLNLESMSPENPRKIDESKFPVPQEWDFVGAEDLRLTEWEGKIYGSGVRRFFPDGRGRMQVSSLSVNKDKATEEERFFIEAPSDVNSYCEKNWMPLTDSPFSYLKWCTPLEVVEADLSRTITPSRDYPVTDPINNTVKPIANLCPSRTRIVRPNKFPEGLEPRGGSQVIPYKDYYIAAIHEVEGSHNEKGDRDALYYHRFIVWDKKWNLVNYSDRFTFIHGRIEFCCGMASYKDNFLITFGFQDNSAYLFKMPKKYFDKLLKI